MYREKLAPTRDIVAFFAFISFFPQLVAGPIERAANLLPQFLRPRTFDTAQAVDGLRQALWGFFKKIVVADNCAILANGIFDNYENLSGGALVIGAVAFSFQIYCDFSGYSDIAIGIARLFGFSLMRNFNYPYFSRDIAEFWRRWHILAHHMVPRLRLHSAGRQPRIEMDGVPQHAGHLPPERILARRELDLHRLGRLPRPAVPAADSLGTQPPAHRGNRRRTYAADGTRGPANRIDLRAGGRGMDHLPRRDHRRRPGITCGGFSRPAILDRVALGGSYESPGINAIVGVAILLAVEWSQRTRQHGLQLTGRAHIRRQGVRYAIYYLLILAIYIMHAQQQTFIYFQF